MTELMSYLDLTELGAPSLTKFPARTASLKIQQVGVTRIIHESVVRFKARVFLQVYVTNSQRAYGAFWQLNVVAKVRFRPVLSPRCTLALL